MNSHGGKRPNSGRPKGAPNKRTAQAIESAKAGGIMPLDYMLSILRDPKADAAARADMAKAAAPYVHPKLASIENKGDLTLTVNVKTF